MSGGALPPDAAGHFQQALAWHQQGRLAEAEILYRTVLAAAPDNADTLYLLGVIQVQRRDFAASAGLLEQVVAFDPGHAAAQALLGVARHGQGQCEAALACFDRALALQPDQAEVLNNRGVVLRELGRAEEAVASYDRAIALAPDYADALRNLGNTLRDLGRTAEALVSYDRFLALQPDHVEVLYRQGGLLLDLDQPEEALARYDQALGITPDGAEFWNNRGIALSRLDRPTGALASYDRALALRPDYAEAWRNRGAALRDLRRLDEALASFDQALALRPDDAEALVQRGVALRELDRPESALASFDQALALLPDHVDGLIHRGELLRALRRHEEAAEAFERALAAAPGTKFLEGQKLHERMQCCDWREHDRQVAAIVAGIREGESAATPFTFLAVSDSAADQLRCARIFGQEKYGLPDRVPASSLRYDHDRIRLAYLSADFHEHATAYLMAELFEQHDAARFELTALSFGPDGAGPMRRRLERAFTRFIDIRGLPDSEAAELLRRLEIDIAIDLKGYTQGCRPRILMNRPAPIQVNYLGFPGTMGTGPIDYIIADRVIIPDGRQSSCSEAVVYLPDCYQPNDRQRVIGDTPTRAEAGLPETGFVFCSFNNNYKITPEIFDVWMRLLRRVEGSVLWLLAGNPASLRNLRREAEARGVAPERLVFAPRVALPAHLARHRLADLLLDTVPCNAHTSASDALWAGLPILTCPGEAFAARVAASLLHAVGLPELVAPTLGDYEALALALAQNPGRLAALRAKLARQLETAPLFDTDRFRRHLEAAYETMWSRHQQGLPPAGFAVPP
jgi:protein O-GlcNAc transferase